MTLKTWLPAAVFAAGLSAAGAADAQIVSSVVNICEVSNGLANTVELRFFQSNAFFEYRFQTLPNGQNHVFPATAFSIAKSRKFPLPAGTYKLSFKSPGQPAIGVYGQNIVVPPFQVSGQTCVVLKPSDRIERVRPPAS